jgi:RNA polymerase sigma-70 factor (ECF subfamily)
VRPLTFTLPHRSVGGLDAIDWAAVRKDPAALTAAVSKIYRLYVKRVYRYCYARVASAADAEDLTAQIFTEVLEGLHRYRHRGHFAAWLFTIVRRRVADHYRQRRDQVSLDAVEHGIGTVDGLFPRSDDDPLRHAIQSESRERLIELVMGLPEKDRELLRLRFAADLTYGEMARVLGRTEGAVKMATHRLIRQLQAIWEDSSHD